MKLITPSSTRHGMQNKTIVTPLFNYYFMGRRLKFVNHPGVLNGGKI
jgi:hypothetical protein